MHNRKHRWREFGEFVQNLPVFKFLLGIAVMAVLYEVGRRHIDEENGYLLNFYTEVLGVAATILIVNTWYHHRDELRSRQDLKDLLLRKVQSPRPEIAQDAFDDLRKLQMIFGEDSVLRKGVFTEVRPMEVDLRYANLSDSIFLSDADFRFSDFSGANLENTVLCNARLTEAKLFGAMFKNADLQGADLSEASLAGADFTGANLKHAKLVPPYKIKYISEPKEAGMLTLPDRKKYALGSDFSKFTDPSHPDFWRELIDKDSPAHPDYNAFRRIVEQMKERRFRS